MRYVLLVDPLQPVASPWLEFAKSDSVESVVGLPLDSAEPYAPLVTELERLNGRLSPDRLAGLVVDQNPRLLIVEDLVRVVLKQPWRIRRPSDLSFSTRVLEPVLLERCKAVGLKRVEHFLTLVRSLAFESLTVVERMTAKRARLVVGISDPSNFRRQLGRLAYLDRVAVTER